MKPAVKLKTNSDNFLKLELAIYIISIMYKYIRRKLYIQNNFILDDLNNSNFIRFYLKTNFFHLIYNIYLAN